MHQPQAPNCSFRGCRSRVTHQANFTPGDDLAKLGSEHFWNILNSASTQLLKTAVLTESQTQHRTISTICKGGGFRKGS